MANILGVVAPNVDNTFPKFLGQAGVNISATAFIDTFISKTGGLDTQVLGAALGKLSLVDPDFAKAIKTEISLGHVKLGPIEQGDLERTFNAEINAV